ncbi:YiiX/YebB-like N1pC/P60 family cysteine hydrolase [uncultured Polaribacter sp.]|uniref:YiiX/YebB-like N1pC/P60 family cysteine hydrolase n=1 Tax=uncultured Polaribacter sp. TaxID=174711 RepID=UPI00260BB506|nr:YiiX/YebB-like N1pC/P60 family cysteine hydrolase [uncultured Polaribacter sp.]
MNKITKQIFTLLLCSVAFFSCKSNQKNNKFEIREGDLFFQNTGTGEIDNAIKNVTATTLSKNYSHVGMAVKKDEKWFVLEAIPKEGICETPLAKFLNRNKNKFNKSQTTVARLDNDYQLYISKAIEYGRERINKPYDDIFLWDDDSYYCSELIYKMFSSQDLPKDSIPFLTHSMTFNDSKGNPMTSWKNYYKIRNQPIPEGIEGTNPNLMASSPYIKFIHDYEKE